mgnify:FL=1
MSTFKKTTVTTIEETVTVKTDSSEEESLVKVAPKDIGKLDMVIAFDTTGSMSQYIRAVRNEVADLIPRLFKDNDDLRLGIVAFGDYCDMPDAYSFGDAYQSILPTDNANDLIKFVNESKNTSGGDWDEFYELVIKKIVEETPWRDGSTRSILLIADAEPHKLGYSYDNLVVGNQIDWRTEAKKAAHKKIKIDTVSISDAPWFKELSQMTNGVSVPFKTGYKTATLVEAAVSSRGTMKAREHFDSMMAECNDAEMKKVFASYKAERDNIKPIE